MRLSDSKAFSWISCILGFLVISISAAQAAHLRWVEEDAFRWAELAGWEEEKEPGFTEISGETSGIVFTNVLNEVTAMQNANLLNGSGVALGDYNSDGLCDVYLCSLEGENRLYQNLGGWRFKDATKEAGVACSDQLSTGAAFVDINGDGRLDLFVTSMGRPHAFFENRGDGTFLNRTEEIGFESHLGGTSMAFEDYDRDGDLDVYVTNYGVTSILRSGGKINIRYVNGRPVVSGRYANRIEIVDGKMFERGERDRFLRNRGDGTFEEVPWDAGLFRDWKGEIIEEEPWDQGLSVIFRDLNGDGWPDLYVCNDAFTPDRFWINQRDGTFQEISPLAWRHTSYFSMGVDVADIDRDGHEDFFVVDMLSQEHKKQMTQHGNMHTQATQIGINYNQPQARRNTLFHGRGDGTFAEVAWLSGVAASQWSWNAAFMDVDLDGYEDILVSNGFTYDVDDADTRNRILAMGRLSIADGRRTLLMYPPLETANVAFRNRGDLTFEEKGKAWGFDSIRVSNGFALGDLDNDGDQDIVVNCLKSGALVYRNDCAKPRLAVRLVGPEKNRFGIGAKILVQGGPVSQSQTMMAGGRYVSSDEPLRVFAGFSPGTRFRIEVRWPDGKRSELEEAGPNRVYEIRHPDLVSDASATSHFDPGQESSLPNPWFEETKLAPDWVHPEERYQDENRQPSLFRRLSQSGPGVSWIDLDRDGWEDLVIGSGKGGDWGIYRNRSGAQFDLWTEKIPAAPIPNDQATIIPLVPESGGLGLLVGTFHYEGNRGTEIPSAHRFDLKTGMVQSGLPGTIDSTGPMAQADVDGDGDLDLFAGGRVIPGQWPKPADSRIYLWEKDQFVLDQQNSELLKGVGLVSGACFTDLDGDGDPELVLACEWGPVRIFRNEKGSLKETTTDWGLSSFTGWWNGIAAGDFDGDGRMDLVASNWGRNHPFEPYIHWPIRCFHGDIDSNGIQEALMARYDLSTRKWVPGFQRQVVQKAFPFIETKFPTHAAYGKASIDELLSGWMDRMELVEAQVLDSMVFLNRDSYFEVRLLPKEAQFAPAFAACVADANGDGKQDIFLSQNFFATVSEEDRYDAGLGLWLEGNGKGDFRAVPASESGIKVYGEQRGAAVADFNRDGRMDLVVTQNGASTKLFQNRNAPSGLRVRVRASDANPDGIGTQIQRVSPQGKTGPMLEIASGSGYWSRNSPTIIFHSVETGDSLNVRFPWGKRVQYAIPDGAKEVVVDPEGMEGSP